MSSPVVKGAVFGVAAAVTYGMYQRFVDEDTKEKIETTVYQILQAAAGAVSNFIQEQGEDNPVAANAAAAREWAQNQWSNAGF